MEASVERSVVVRPAAPDDAEQLQRNCMSMATEEQVREEISEHAREADHAQLVAEVGGVVVGNAVVIRREHPLMRHRAGLFSLVVSEAYQGRGIARRLVEAASARAAAMGAEILETSCRGGEPAEAVYRQLGFVEYGRLPGGLVEPGGERRVFEEAYFYRRTDDA